MANQADIDELDQYVRDADAANEAGILQVGQIVRLTHFTNELPNLKLTFKANQGREARKDKQVFVMLLLGVEPQHPENETDLLDSKAVLNQLGWIEKGQASDGGTK